MAVTWGPAATAKQVPVTVPHEAKPMAVHVPGLTTEVHVNVHVPAGSGFRLAGS